MAASSWRMPAEWEEQESVWFAWPGQPDWWKSVREQALGQFCTMLKAVTRATPVSLLCAKAYRADAVRRLQAAGVDLAMVAFCDYRTDDVWCRDFGPLFVKSVATGRMQVVDFGFNAWGGKFPGWKRDDAAPQAIAAALGLRCRTESVILEGGALEINGAGLCITTDNVVLNANRQSITRRSLQALMRKTLGVTDVIWLADGLLNDDTDGHIDNITRFYAERGVLTCSAPKSNPNHPQLAANRAVLEAYRFADGGRLDIMDLPLPEPILRDGQIMPASYANFLITNGVVVVPTYGQKRRDAEALAVIRTAFPGHEVIGVECTAILCEGGAVHCLSQQQPG